MHSFEEKLLPEELAILNRLTNYSLNFEAMAVVTNLYRAAQRLRAKMERDVLSTYNISWTAFTLLYNLWIWGSMEPRKLAKSMGVTVAAVSSITNTLERKQWCKREANPRDRRLVLLTLTDEGKKVIEELYPEFNQGEADIVSDLDSEEQEILTQLLRKVNKKLED
ncbi:MarR family transcriptional regulator [Aneurinibacillus aneurinilyticus]|uniref:Transcriptional regulator, MarR family n=1 Tax=Aneurinibacillus aneurinilyticus ATCC 12856 TaxID=649747 RepID=U1WJ70_ANEAE|nr:MarR family transcriptional regulator [Aneurinibacillus aneurinilyticus]ERI08639.1 transcriptional regulator, MarR family [Aneurinibacillus aneurinilyticus ATCC 12856]MED0705832.1 MarR family transcriptional regulator [Aneurinibacillus aneurinilyticus]MED0724124.1 MarR family transcriptional regulator [Aneurinibacillus aneurinilyticus]MED0733951.1 MarR family transcriptional regulator [Aneurinibacillus aneurinilyticus]MED0739130.1 MarR family transcriptional regulator [Aneurinibacillus aneu